MNKDEALKCLSIAQKHRDSDNLPSAIRFTQKSINLYSTPEAEKLLAKLLAQQSSSGPSSSGTQAHPSSSGAHQRGTPSAKPSTPKHEEPAREFTPAQAGYVKRIRACKPTDYYAIMGLTKDCEDAEIKKAYKKQAILIHPDRNSAPGAKQAFQMLSDAFQKLDDPQNRAAFDRYGADENGKTPQGFGGGGGGGRQAQPFQGGDLSPEDLFNMFFGGAGGGGGFQGGFGGGGGPIFTASFGGPNGFQRAQSRRTNAAQAAQDTEPRSLLVQLMPLILLFGFSILSSLPSMFSEAPIPQPRWSWTPAGQYKHERATGVDGVRHFVNPTEFNNNAAIQADLASGKAINGGTGDKIRGQRESLSPSETSKVADQYIPRGGGRTYGALSKFDASVDASWKQDVYTKCQRAMDSKQQRKDAEIGLFSYGTDWDKVKSIEAENPPSCVELRRLGVIR